MAQDDAVRQLNALLEVGRLVASGKQMAEVLNGIAYQAAAVVDGCSAGILWPHRDPQYGWVFTVGGSWRLSEYYRSTTNKPSPLRLRTPGPQALCIERREPVLIENTELDLGFRPWRSMARKEGFRATASVPLLSDQGPLGALDVHRAEPGPWPEFQVDLLMSFAVHAANAVRMAKLLEGHRQQLSALSRLVRALREQTHEHANRIHAISGLLALGEVDEARAFAETLETAHGQSFGEVAERVGNPILAGLITADILIGRQRGIDIRLNRKTRLHELPEYLSEAGAVTVVGNILQNAVEAVVTLPKSRRRVDVALTQTDDRTIFRVRDWGEGVSRERRRTILEPGYTTKSDHPGLGLALVADAVNAAGGQLQIRSVNPGTAVSAVFDTSVP